MNVNKKLKTNHSNTADESLIIVEQPDDFQVTNYNLQPMLSINLSNDVRGNKIFYIGIFREISSR